MSLDSLPEPVRAAWLEHRNHVAGFLVHLGQRMIHANEKTSPENSAAYKKAIHFSTGQNGEINVSFFTPFDVTGFTEAYSAKSVFQSSVGMRFMENMLSMNQSSAASDSNVISMTFRMPEPDNEADLTAILRESLKNFCLKDIELKVNDEVIASLYADWEAGLVLESGADYSIVMDDGVPISRLPASEGMGVIWFTKQDTDYFYPARPSDMEQINNMLRTINQSNVSPGMGAINTRIDDLSLEARLRSWGLESMRDVTSDWLAALSPDEQQHFLSSVVTNETAYSVPDIHIRGRSLPSNPLSPEMAVFIDMWSAASRQAARAAGIDSVRIGLCKGDSAWAESADGIPVLYVDPDKAMNWSNQEMLAETIYMISGIREHKAREAGESFDRARDVAKLFAMSSHDNDAYIALRKELRSAMGNAAIILKDGIPDSVGQMNGGSPLYGLSDRILEWAWPDRNLADPLPAEDIHDRAMVTQLPDPVPTSEPELQQVQIQRPARPMPAPAQAPLTPTPPESEITSAFPENTGDDRENAEPGNEDVPHIPEMETPEEWIGDIFPDEPGQPASPISTPRGESVPSDLASSHQSHEETVHVAPAPASGNAAEVGDDWMDGLGDGSFFDSIDPEEQTELPAAPVAPVAPEREIKPVRPRVIKPVTAKPVAMAASVEQKPRPVIKPLKPVIHSPAAASEGQAQIDPALLNIGPEYLEGVTPELLDFFDTSYMDGFSENMAPENINPAVDHSRSNIASNPEQNSTARAKPKPVKLRPDQISGP